MIRPEVTKSLQCPAVGLATSWTIGRKGVPIEGGVEKLREQFKREVWPFAKGKIPKNNAKARRLREEGNKCYTKRTSAELDRALCLYNESICSAEAGTEELGMGFANRSAVYFSRKQYQDCLDNVLLAKGNKYPEDKLDKLNERLERCRAALDAETAQDSVVPEEITITTQKAIDGLRSNRDVKVGETLLKENSFLVVLEAEAIYQRCDYCGSPNNCNLLPCSTCTSVMYCNTDCQQQAYRLYHRYECEVIDDLQFLFRGPKVTRQYAVALRLFWFSWTHNFEPKEQAVNEYLKRIFALKSSSKEDPTAICISQFLTVLISVIALDENESLGVGLSTDASARELLFQLVHSAALFSNKRATDMTCYYPLFQQIQHSCTPNSAAFFHDGRLDLVAMRPIAAESPISVAYDPDLIVEKMAKEKRQQTCYQEFSIQCECEGCTNNYPTLEKMVSDEQLAQELSVIRQNGEDGTQKLLLERFIERHNEAFPKRELAEALQMYRTLTERRLASKKINNRSMESDK